MQLDATQHMISQYYKSTMEDLRV